MKILGKVILALGLVLVIVSCATPIGAVKDDPQRFAGRTITVKAEVKRAIPLLIGGLSLQFLDQDGDGALLITRTGRSRGDVVSVKVDVVAFPEDETNEAWEEGADGLGDFLIELGITDRGGARNVVKKIVGAVRGATDALGQLFLLLEVEES